MDVKYINCFVQGVEELFATMLNCTAVLDKVGKTNSEVTRREIIGLIGLSGPVRGTVALIMPIETAFKAVERFTGTAVTEFDDDATDAVAELVNIVAGSAKAKMSSDTEVLSLSIPNVIQGLGHTVLSPSWATWVEVIFSSEVGPFHLRITMGK